KIRAIVARATSSVRMAAMCMAAVAAGGGGNGIVTAAGRVDAHAAPAPTINISSRTTAARRRCARRPASAPRSRSGEHNLQLLHHPEQVRFVDDERRRATNHVVVRLLAQHAALEQALPVRT